MKRVLKAHAQGHYLAYDSTTGKLVEKSLTNAVLPNGKTEAVMVLG